MGAVEAKKPTRPILSTYLCDCEGKLRHSSRIGSATDRGAWELRDTNSYIERIIEPTYLELV